MCITIYIATDVMDYPRYGPRKLNLGSPFIGTNNLVVHISVSQLFHLHIVN